MPDAKVNVMLDGEVLDANLLADLTRVEVRESDDAPSVAILRFKVQQDPTGGMRPLDDERFEPLTPLGVELGAPGSAPVRLFQGFVSHVRPHFEAIESNCYVEVVGMDAAVIMDGEDRSVAWPDQTDGEVASAILSKYGLTPDVADTADRHSADRYLLVQRESDWRFLKRLARRNGLRMWMEYDAAQDAVVASMKPRPLDAEPQADLIMLQSGANLKWLDVQWRSTGPARRVGAAIDPIAKKIVRTPDAGSLELLGDSDPAEALEKGLTEAGAESGAGWLVDAPRTEAGIGAAGAGAIDDDRFVLDARGEVDPALFRGLLRARRPALVRGVGKRLAGAWYVHSVRTTYAEGKIAQTFIAQRNGLGLTGGEDFGQSAEEESAQ